MLMHIFHRRKIPQFAMLFTCLIVAGFSFLISTKIAFTSSAYSRISLCVGVYLLSLCFWFLMCILIAKNGDHFDGDDLFHFTNSWGAIKKSKVMYCGADNRIYMTDSPNNVSLGLNCAGNDNFMLIFKGGRKKANQIIASPFVYFGFKVIRGEWVFPRNSNIKINSYCEFENSKEVVIDEYFQFPGEECQEILGRIKIIVRTIALEPLLLAGYVTLITDYYMNSGLSRLSFLKSWPMILVYFLIAGMLVWWLIQSKINAWSRKVA